MTDEDELRRALRGHGDEGRPPDVSGLIRAGRRLRRQRHLAIAAGVAGAMLTVVLVVVSGALRWTQAELGPASPGPQTPPSHSAVTSSASVPTDPAPPSETQAPTDDPPTLACDGVRVSDPTKTPVAGVFFSCVHDPDFGVRLVRRELGGGSPEERIRAALVAYLAGPTAQERRTGLFTGARGGNRMIASVTVDAGLATVDFHPVFAERNSGYATTSAANALRSMTATVQAASGVKRVRYRLGGDCAAFFGLLHEMTCHVVGSRSPGA